jgi:hypothetical protein
MTAGVMRRLRLRGKICYKTTAPIYGSPAWETAVLEELGFGPAAVKARDAAARGATLQEPAGAAQADGGTQLLLDILMRATSTTTPEDAVQSALEAIKVRQRLRRER